MADNRNEVSWADRALQHAKELRDWFSRQSDPDVAYSNTYELLRKRGYDDEKAHQLAEAGTAGYGRRVGTSKLIGQSAAYMNPVTGPPLVARDLTHALTPEEFAGATPAGGLAELGVHAAEAGYEKGKEWLGYAHGGDVERQGYEEGGPPEAVVEKAAFVPPTIEVPEGYGRDERTKPIEEVQRVVARPERGERLQEGAVFQHEPSKIGNADYTFNRMIQLESGWNHWGAKGSPKISPAGAVGIAQVMPTTGPIAAAYADLPWDPKRFYNDPDYNLKLGRAYYDRQLAKYGDPVLAAAAYNTGPGNLDKALARAQQQGGSWTSYLHPETQNYVRFVTQNARQRMLPRQQVAQATQSDASGERYGVFAFGTNDPDPDVTLKSAERLWQQSQRTGMQPVFILPNPNDARFAPMAQALKQFADKNGIRYEIPVYEQRDPLHMTPKSAQDIAAKYPNAVVAGDSNSWRIQKYGYNRPVTGPNTFVDPQSKILLGRVGAGSPDVANWFTNYADYMQRQGRKAGGETKNKDTEFKIEQLEPETKQDVYSELTRSEPMGLSQQQVPSRYFNMDEQPPVSHQFAPTKKAATVTKTVTAGPVSGTGILVGKDDVPMPIAGFDVSTQLPGNFSAGFSRTKPVGAPNVARSDIGTLSRDFGGTSLNIMGGKAGGQSLVGGGLGGKLKNGQWNVGMNYMPQSKAKTFMGQLDFMFKDGGEVYPVREHTDWEEALDYEKEGGKLTHMSPDEYLARVEPLEMNDHNKRVVKHFEAQIKKGVKLDPVAIEKDGHPNGRHRAMAAKALGVKKLPVVVVAKKKSGGSIVDRALMLVSTKADRRRGRPD